MSRLTNGAGIHAVSKSSNNTTNDHLRDAICAGLQRCADAEDYASKPDALPPTQALASEEDEDGTEETALAV